MKGIDGKYFHLMKWNCFMFAITAKTIPNQFNGLHWKHYIVVHFDLSLSLSLYVYIHTHTYTYVYKYIYTRFFHLLSNFAKDWYWYWYWYRNFIIVFWLSNRGPLSCATCMNIDRELDHLPTISLYSLNDESKRMSLSPFDEHAKRKSQSQGSSTLLRPITLVSLPSSRTMTF